jgi:exopolysaccharide biosynthesis polyprenyl glycosylphosphotransferase
MGPVRRKILLKSLKATDLIVMAGSFLLTAFILNAEFGSVAFSELLSMRVKVQNVLTMLGFAAAWYGIFSAFGLYESKRFSMRSQVILDLLKATTTGTVVIWLASIALTIRLVTPPFPLLFWATVTVVTVLSRLVLRYLLVQFRLKGRNLRHMIIVGTNARAISFAKKVEKRPDLGYRILGFVDEGPGTRAFQGSGYSLVAQVGEFHRFVTDNVVDEVVIGLPMKSCYHQSSLIVSLCEEQGIIVRFLPDIFDLKRGPEQGGPVGDPAVVTIHVGQMTGFSIALKRLMDVALSSLVLLLFSPVFGLVALVIKKTSRGPVFFVQERVGLNKRRFRLYKFRTMVADAEKRIAELEHLNEVDGPAFKIKNDPRITPVGRFLRKTSIDELPQLLNVLKGDMSLVGPRPLPFRDYEGFDVDWHRRRFSVRPGITCLWQANGRSNVSFDHWMELDMQYIDEWSLGLDVKILVMTIPAVLRGSGAA